MQKSRPAAPSHNSPKENPSNHVDSAPWELTPAGALWSPRYRDLYYTGDGADESQLVFIEGNHLENRWKKLLEEENNLPFTIVEVGLGTGLNFALAAELWRQLGGNRKLCYTAVEAHPIAHHTLKKVLQGWSAPLFRWGEQMLESWPAGFSTRFEDGGEVELTILHGPLSQMLNRLPELVDCWFLDGFAPEKNPDAWSVALFEEMGQRTTVGGTAATFTVSGMVRRRLGAQGFRVEKKRGYGTKKERLEAKLPARSQKEAADHQRAHQRLLQEVLHQAVGKGEENRVEELLGEGAVPTSATLHLALRCDGVTILKLLLDAGGNPNSVNNKGRTLLIEAIRISNSNAEELLLAFGASEMVADYKGRSADLWRAIKKSSR